MYYSLTSTRKIGDYEQVITSYQKHTPPATASSSQSLVMNVHNEWRTIIASFDSASWETGALKWSTMVGLDDHKTDNTIFSNKAADASITITSTLSGNVESTTFKLKDVAQGDLATQIQSTYYNMTGRDLSSTSVKLNTRISNVILNLHEKESD